MRARALLAVIGLATTAPVLAQADKARMDDFAVSAAAAPGEVREPDRASPLPEAVPGIDRSLAISQPPAADRLPLAQLSRPGDTPRANQLSNAEESRKVAARSVSSTSDSRPQGTAVLGGRDRCSPDSEAERRGQCQQIIERRADEFNATEAPRLSAEQVLLAQRQADEAALANSTRLRARLTGVGTPDAGDPSNQELASIYLERADAETTRQPADPASEADQAALGEILKGLQIEVNPANGK